MTGPPSAARLTLVVRRTIRATPERLFAAWTQPAQLRRWWGPEGVRCVGAEVDLRVGGRYRIDNAFPDGKLLSIVGEFEAIEPPHRLVYTWQVDGASGTLERIAVRFQADSGGSTEVVVTHERIGDEALREQHRRGWEGCLNGLAEHLKTGPV
jgi:uncharacterized protein YndB with AHSA1/START domain